jgi:hypothetical protein
VAKYLIASMTQAPTSMEPTGDLTVADQLNKSAWYYLLFWLVIILERHKPWLYYLIKNFAISMTTKNGSTG